jgi:SNF2 family DNA or RNA helicase
MNIKLAAERLDGVENACMLFDDETLMPMFRLVVGQPGSSYTYVIAEKAGLPAKVIEAAREKTTNDKLTLDSLLQQLHQKQQELKRLALLFDEKQLQAEASKTKYDELYEKWKQRMEKKNASAEDDHKLMELGKKFKLWMKEWEGSAADKKAVMQKIKPATYLLEPGEYSDTLPPLNTVEVRSTMDMTHYAKMKRDFVVEFEGNEKAIAANAAVVTGKLQQMSSGFVYQTEKQALIQPGKFATTKTAIWFSTHKFDRLAELLEENQHANTIIAYMYQEELAEIKKRYPKVVTLDDANAIERWNRGEVGLLAVHPKSAGHGLNLQHGGSHIVFLSLPWSLELYEQTIGRLHRSGQIKTVWCYIMMTNKTVDEKILGALQDKRSISDVALEELK